MAQPDRGTLVDLIVDLPLYELAPYPDNKVQEVILAIHAYDGKFDTYCPGCKAPATLAGVHEQEYAQYRRISRIESAMSATSGNILSVPSTFLEKTSFSKVMTCTRGAHNFIFHFQRVKGGLMKVGQYPSLADIAAGEVGTYRKVLGEENSRALMKAVGLHAHGVGAGSLIYLRRIFESLVEEAHGVAKADAGWDEALYQSLRMSDRLKALSAHLPDLVSQNYQLYSVLSEHIHSLPEKTCLENFSIAKEGILLIAEEKLILEQRKARAANYLRAQNDLVSSSTQAATRKTS